MQLHKTVSTIEMCNLNSGSFGIWKCKTLVPGGMLNGDDLNFGLSEQWNCIENTLLKHEIMLKKLLKKIKGPLRTSMKRKGLLMTSMKRKGKVLISQSLIWIKKSKNK